MKRWFKGIAVLMAFFASVTLLAQYEPTSSSLPFAVQADGRGFASFQNFHMRQKVWGSMIYPALAFEMTVHNARCSEVMVYFDVLSKGGAYLKQRKYQDTFRNPTPGATYATDIADPNLDWNNVGLVRVWPMCPADL